MNTESVTAELKQHCIAIAALMGELKKQHPEPGKVTCIISTDSDSYGSIMVTFDTKEDFTGIINTASVDMLNATWFENIPCSGKFTRGDSK